MAAVLDSHFHCPDCGPLVYGQTRALCGQVIPAPVVGNGPTRKCPACKNLRRTHRKDHH
jgi:hypothetical protein